MPKFSLAVATLGRDTELRRLFVSLKNQDYKDFEVIVVDQNKDNICKIIVEEFKNELDIKYFQVDFKAVAKARDYGIKKAEGEIIAYPDDDCFYEKDVLSRVKAKFEDSADLAIFSTASYCILNPNRFSIGMNSPVLVPITKTQLMGVEFTVFFNTNVIKREDLYLDTDFGIGSKYKSTEGIEVLYRLISQGYKGLYDPAVKIYHKSVIYYESLDRFYRDAYGEGAFIRKFLNRGDVEILYYVLRKMIAAPLTKMAIAIVSFRGKAFIKGFNHFRGIWDGFFAYENTLHK